MSLFDFHGMMAYSEAGVTIINGDSSELCVMKEFSGKADAIITDPPYKLTSGGRNRGGDGKHKTMSGIFSGENYDNSGLLMEVPSWGEVSSVITSIAGPNAEAYVMANDKNIFEAQAALAGDKWKLHNLLVWDKSHPIPNRWYMKHLEFVLYMWKGKARGINNKGHKQLSSEKRTAEEAKVHPTQKPISLMMRYIENSTDVGDTVFDPYAGSGSTLIAAALSGRNAVGFEKSEERFGDAVSNIRHHLNIR